jgi:hypothetical protein
MATVQAIHVKLTWKRRVAYNIFIYTTYFTITVYSMLARDEWKCCMCGGFAWAVGGFWLLFVLCCKFMLFNAMHNFIVGDNILNWQSMKYMRMSGKFEFTFYWNFLQLTFHRKSLNIIYFIDCQYISEALSNFTNDLKFFTVINN